MSNVALTNDKDQLKELYGIVDRSVQEDVPMFSAYIIKTMAAANKRLTGVKPSVYGFPNHVEQWMYPNRIGSIWMYPGRTTP